MTNTISETDVIAQIRQVFEQLGHAWVEPYSTTVGAINRREVGNHRGLYYIYPKNNFYFGLAATGTIIARFQTHRLKLDVDQAALYGPAREKKQPGKTFPEGWKAGVCKYIIEGVDSIPSHFDRISPTRVKPGVLDFPVIHKVDVDTLPVLIWNLDHLTVKQIKEIEEAVISIIWPYCNDETFRKRKREQNV